MNELKKNYKNVSIVLILISILSFFLGFYLDENSAGAGSYEGDFLHIWKNLQIFANNDILNSITHEDYFDSRSPIAYILHKLFNPFLDSEIGYRRSVFIISLIAPILFYYCLKIKFFNKENILLILITSTIFLSPYFRTSAYWGLEENYGIIFLLASFLFLQIFLENKNYKGQKIYIELFLLTFSSSLCFYFDQKLLIIPIICLLKILQFHKEFKFKILSILLYSIFSIPYIYLIFLWGNLIPTTAAESRQLGDAIFLDHIGYALTIMAFYLVPILLFKINEFKFFLRTFFSNKINYYLIFLFFIYIILLLIFTDFQNTSTLGKGLVQKISALSFENDFIARIFTYFCFLISFIIVLFFITRNYIELIFFVYFLFLSLIMWPIQQEYFDPLIILMIFTFFNSKLKFNYNNSIILFLYLSIFLVVANVYYLITI